MKRILAMLMAVLMLVSAIPLTAFAQDEAAVGTDAIETPVAEEDIAVECDTEFPDFFGAEVYVGDDIYYIEEGELWFSANSSRPVSLDTEVTWVIEHNGEVYYAKSEGFNTLIRKVGANEDIAKIFCPVECFDVDGDFVYYSYNGEIFKYNTETNEENVIRTGIDNSTFFVNENGEVINCSIDKNYEFYPGDIEDSDEVKSSFSDNKAGSGASGEQWLWPVEGHYLITSNYGYRSFYNPNIGSIDSSIHYAIDIGGLDANGNRIYGKPIRASRSGVITYSLVINGGYGVYIDHEDGYVSRYLHMSSYDETNRKVFQSRGNRVNRGEIIGYVGDTSYISGIGITHPYGAHLDFKITFKGEAVDPMPAESDAESEGGVIRYSTFDSPTTYNIDYAFSLCDTCSTQGTKAFKYGKDGKCPDCEFVYNYASHPSTSENGLYVRNTETKYKKFYLRETPYDHYYNKKGEQIDANNLVEKAQNYQSLEVLGLVKNADGGEWFEVKTSTGKKGYIVAHKVRVCFNYQSPYADSEITFNIAPGDYPVGNIEPKPFTFKGVINSKYDLWKVSVEIYNSDTKKLVQQGSSTFRYDMGPDYDFAIYRADDSLKVQNLPDGNYYIKYNAWDLSTENADRPTATWQTPVFTVVKQVPTASVLPQIWATLIKGGVSLKVTASDSLATIHVSGGPNGEVTGCSSVTYNITEPGTWTITAWTTASNKTDSSKIYSTVYLSRISTPNICDAVYTKDGAYTTIDGKGEIHYTTNGATPTEFSPIYSGPIFLEKNQTVKAISIDKGKSNSYISEKSFTLTVPNSPVISLITESKVAQGEFATISWEPVNTALSYTAHLMRDGEIIDSVTTTGTNSTFVLPKTSDSENVAYTISVVATNCVGDSRESNIVEVMAMHPLTVTVVDRIVREGQVDDATVTEIQTRVKEHFGDTESEIEGNIISVQRVPYGTKASKPSTPSKNGFAFAGYSEELYYPVTEDKTVYALYEVNYYTAAFYDTENGTRTANPVSANRYMYSECAPEPSVESLKVPKGYIFSGWFIDSNVSDGTGYAFMDGDVVMDASYSWEFEQLPVYARIDSVVRDNKSYAVTISLKNTPNGGTEGIQSRVIAALYTNDGKCVATQLHELDTEFLGNSHDYDWTETITILYDEHVTSVSVYVVGVVDGKTSGALSPVTTSTNITLKADSGFWEPTWSEWQDEYVSPSDTCQVKTRTVYRYSDKEFTERFDTATLSGWYQNGNRTVRHTDRYTSNAYLAPEDTAWRTRTVNEVKVYRKVTQWMYSRRYGISQSDGYCYTWPGISGICTIYEDTGWLDYRLPVDSSSPDYHQGVYYTCYNATGTSAYIRGNKYWWHEVSREIDVLDYVYYDVTDTYYTYYFWKWGDWSEWLEYNPGAGNTRQVESKIQYSYRGLSESANSTEEENVFDYENTIVLDSVTEDLNGKLANVMVYKKTNTDPTEEQMEYISQVKIGEGNTVYFAINTREKPHYIGTGDFVVALAVEGSNKLINIDYIEADKPKYAVKFQDDTGNIFHTEIVKEGDGIDVNAIGIPEVSEGNRFLKWDKSLVDIKSDMTVSPITEREKYSIVFVDYENHTAEIVDYRYGDTISRPDNPTLEGYTFNGWFGLSDGVNTVTGSAVLTADWIPNEYTVEFRTLDDVLVSSQTVYYGESAQVPEAIEINGTVYNWDVVSSWWNVTNDMVVYPYIPQNADIASPVINADLNEGGGFFYAELSADEGNKIFYSYYYEITDEMAYNYAENLRHEQDINEDLSAQEVTELMATNAVSEEDTEAEDYYTDYTVYISEYSEPIKIMEGMMLYTFSMDAEYQVSPVAVYEYGYSDTEEKRTEYDFELDEDCPAIIMPEISANPGETVSVPITLTNNPGITGLSLVVGYDTNNLKLVETENGDVFENSEFSEDIRDDGSCKFTWESNELNTTNGTIVTLKFLVGETAGDFDITLEINEAIAPNEEEQPFATVDGQLTNTGTSLETGDVNGDGEIDFSDGILVLKYDVGLMTLNDEQKTVGDVNGDGEVDFADAILILKYDVGLITTFAK